ncbi:hypothetical protein GN958_ATG00809, partial [Phytophthora infestans]
VQPSSPGDDQLAAAAPIVRENYAADIEAARARAQIILNESPPTSQLTVCLPSPYSPSQRAPTHRALMNAPSPMANSPVRITYPRSPLIPTLPHVQDVDCSSEEAGESDNINGSNSIHPAQTPTRNDDANEDGEDSALGSELIADSTDDLNVVIDHAIEHQFGKLDSGDEAESNDMETG